MYWGWRETHLIIFPCVFTSFSPLLFSWLNTRFGTESMAFVYGIRVVNALNGRGAENVILLRCLQPVFTRVVIKCESTNVAGVKNMNEEDRKIASESGKDDSDTANAVVQGRGKLVGKQEWGSSQISGLSISQIFIFQFFFLFIMEIPRKLNSLSGYLWASNSRQILHLLVLTPTPKHVANHYHWPPFRLLRCLTHVYSWHSLTSCLRPPSFHHFPLHHPFCIVNHCFATVLDP